MDPAPGTVERQLRMSGSPGAALLSRLPAERLESILRDTEGIPCFSPLLDARLKALGVKKLGHRLQIQDALKDARERAIETPEQRVIDLSDAIAPSPLSDLTNSASIDRTPKMKPFTSPASDVKQDFTSPASDVVCKIGVADAPKELAAPLEEEHFECVLETNDLMPAPEEKPIDGGSTSIVRRVASRLMHIPGRAAMFYIRLGMLAARLALTIGLRLADRVANRSPVQRERAIALVGRIRSITGITA